MSPDNQRDTENHPVSLADSVAAWTPPWERAPEPPPESEAEAEPETEAGPEPEAGSEPEAEAAPDVQAAPEAEPVPEDGSGPEAELASSPDAEPALVAESEVGPETLSPGVDGAAEVAEDAPVASDADADSSAEGAGPAVEVAEGEEVVAAGEVAESRALPELDDPETLRAALEAILTVVDEPVAEVTLAQVLERPTERVGVALRELAAEYTEQRRGFELRQAAGGWRLYTRDDFAPYVERFVLDGQQVRLTQAALETLAVVAYRQPVTRTRISAIRGVNCDGVIRTLLTRGLVEECGEEPDSGAHLYRTSRLFLERMGIDSVADLPELAPFLPDELPEEI